MTDIVHTQRLSPTVSNPVRRQIKEHLHGGGCVEDLGIEPNRPASDLAFAVVGHTPKATLLEDWYRCSYCETDRKFAAGLIVLMADQKLRLIGLHCWADHFLGDAFDSERQDYNLYLRKEEFGPLREEIAAEAGNYLRRLRNEWSRSRSGILLADEFGAHVSKALPLLYQHLDKARKDGGRLTIERRATERERELSGAASAPDRGARRGPEYVTKLAVTLDGLTLLTPRLSESRILAAFERLEQSVSLLMQNNWDTLELQEFGARLRTVIEGITRALDAADGIDQVGRDARILLSRPSLSNIVTWARDEDGPLAKIGELRVDGYNLIFEADDGSVKRVSFPNVDHLGQMPTSDVLRRFTKRQ